jgi:PPM family protein phosphatase
VSDFAPCEYAQAPARGIFMLARLQTLALAALDRESRATRHHGLSDRGLCRANNEDALLADPRIGLFLVCDGVGGKASGEVAAGEAVTLIHEQVQRGLAADARGEPGDLSLARILRAAIQHASRVIFELGAQHREYTGMSTTATVALVLGGWAVIGQVGDSRLYHARGDAVRQITEDHTLLNLQVRRGEVSPERARGRKSSITRALGLRSAVEVDIFALRLAAGDRLLLCTDGLHEHLGRDETLAALFRMDVRDAAPAAIRHANERGGRDNATALFVEVLTAAD